jgi:hypothetical protein
MFKEKLTKHRNIQVLSALINLLTTCWDKIFPSSEVFSKPRVGSDHTHLVVDTGGIRPPKTKQFRFEKWWLQVLGFDQVVAKFWSAPCSCTKAIDRWQFKIRNTMKGLKGWNANLEASQNKDKRGLVAEYDLLDIVVENTPLSPNSKKRMQDISSELLNFGKMKRSKLDRDQGRE